MKICRKEKRENGTRYYVLGCCVYELVRKGWFRYYKLFGVEIARKFLKRKEIIRAEEILLEKAKQYCNVPDEERLYLCFDCLEDPHAEAIDAWTLFRYLQKKRYPSRYVILRDNPLYKELVARDALQDVIAIQHEKELLTEHSAVVAQAKGIFCSFGYSTSDILAKLPFLKYVFIEHGVMLLKKRTVHYYVDSGDSGSLILTPTRLTLDFYKDEGIMTGRRVCCGLSRWDNLTERKGVSDIQYIFIYFTWRVSFFRHPETLNVYVNRIKQFIEKLVQSNQQRNEVKVYMSLHHTVLRLYPEITTEFSQVELVDPNQVSTMIRKADLCVTDYSSICFDFMYRDVPVVFYRFDADVSYPDERDNQDAADAASSDSQLYNVFYDEQSALDRIDFYIQNGCILEGDNKKKNKQIFWEKGNNCERLIEFVEKNVFS